MLLSNPAKSFLTVLLLLFLLTGCRFWQGDQNTNTSRSSDSEFPFSTREPEIFQAEIVVISGDMERKTRVSRQGDKRRIDYDFGGEDQHAILQTDKEYIISNREKIYAENSPGQRTGAENEITPLLLNQRNYSKFEEIGRENNLIKYRARINESTASEIIIYIDEAIGLAVNQEFFSINGEEKTLQFKVEMRNYKAEVDESEFQIPAGFRKVSAEEFYKIIR